MGIKPRRLDPDTIYNFLGRRRVKSADDKRIERGNIVEIVSSQPLGKPTVKKATPDSKGRLLVAHITLLPGMEGEAVEWSQTEWETGEADIGSYVYMDDSGDFTTSPRGRAVGQVLRAGYVLVDPNANWVNDKSAESLVVSDSGQLSATAFVSLSDLNDAPVLVVPEESGSIVVDAVELRTSIASPFEAAQNAGFVLRYAGGRREASDVIPAKALVSSSSVGIMRSASIVAPESAGVCLSLKGGKLKGDGEGSLSITVFYRIF